MNIVQEVTVIVLSSGSFMVDHDVGSICTSSDDHKISVVCSLKATRAQHCRDAHHGQDTQPSGMYSCYFPVTFRGNALPAAGCSFSSS